MKKIIFILFSFFCINYNFSFWNTTIRNLQTTTKNTLMNTLKTNINLSNTNNSIKENENNEIKKDEEVVQQNNHLSNQLYFQLKWKWVINDTFVIQDNLQWDIIDNEKLYFKNLYWSKKLLYSTKFELSEKNYIHNKYDILEKSLNKWKKQNKWYIKLWIWFYIIWIVIISSILILINNLIKKHE